MAVVKNKDGKTYHIDGKVKLPNGKYQAYKRTKIKFTRKKDAELEEQKIRQSILSSSPKLTMDQLVDLFHNRYELTGIDEVTLISYESYYHNHIKDFFGSIEISEISVSMVEDWMVHMIRKKKSDGTSYGVRTINNAKMILSRYLTYAIQKEYIDVNPVKKVKDYKPKVDLENTLIDAYWNFWEYDEYIKFINSVDDRFWQIVFSTFFKTGCREGELFSLSWSMVDFENRKLKIRRNITFKTSIKGKYRIKDPKNRRSIRDIDMDDALYNDLLGLYNEQIKKDGFTLDYYVFGDIQPLSRSTTARYLDHYINKAGVKRITPHGFRHSHASMLIRNKVDDSLIAERLGHSVEELRRTYAHVYESTRTDLIKKINDIFKIQ